MLNLPSCLHIRITFVNTLVEKFTSMSSICRSGSIIRRFLCIGVNHSLASAWTPYWSSVERVRASQMFLSGHHSPWSDQSIAMSNTHTHTQPKTQIRSLHKSTSAAKFFRKILSRTATKEATVVKFCTCVGYILPAYGGQNHFQKGCGQGQVTHFKFWYPSDISGTCEARIVKLCIQTRLYQILASGWQSPLKEVWSGSHDPFSVSTPAFRNHISGTAEARVAMCM